MDAGEIYMNGLIAAQEMAGDDDASDASAEGERIDEDDGQYSTMTVEEDDQDDIYGHEGDRPADVLLPGNPNDTANSGVEIVGMPTENENSTTGEEDDDSAANLEELPIPKLKSIAHHYIKAGRAVLCSFDLEHGGEFCGELQYSAELSRIVPLPNDPLNIVREQNTFNKYIKGRSKLSQQTMCGWRRISVPLKG